MDTLQVARGCGALQYTNRLVLKTNDTRAILPSPAGSRTLRLKRPAEGPRYTRGRSGEEALLRSRVRVSPGGCVILHWCSGGMGIGEGRKVAFVRAGCLMPRGERIEAAEDVRHMSMAMVMASSSAYQAHGGLGDNLPNAHLHHPRRQLAMTGIDNNNFVRHPRKAVSGSGKTCLSCGTGWGNGASCIGACVQMRWAGAIGNADWRLGIEDGQGTGDTRISVHVVTEAGRHLGFWRFGGR